MKNNNKIQNFHFDTFTGSDVNIRLIFSHKDDSNKKHVINIATLSSISGQIQVEGVPRYTMGQADPSAYSQGKRLISGMFVVETLNKSFVKELEALMPKDYFRTVTGITEQEIDTNTQIPIDRLQALRYADEISPFDIEIIAIKEDNPSAKAKRTIKGCQIMSESSGIGLSSIDSQEIFQFLAMDITPLEKIYD